MSKKELNCACSANSRWVPDPLHSETGLFDATLRRARIRYDPKPGAAAELV